MRLVDPTSGELRDEPDARLTAFERGVAASLGHAAIYIVEPTMRRAWIDGNRQVERVRIGVTTAPQTLLKPARQWCMGQDVSMVLLWTEGAELANRVVSRMRVMLADDADGLLSGWLDMPAGRAFREVQIAATVVGVETFDDRQRLEVIAAEVALRSRSKVRKYA